MEGWVLLAGPVLGSLLSVLAAIGWARALSTERRAEVAEKELRAAHARNRELERAVAELLKTRRAATRERFLGLIEEHKGGS